MALGVESLSDRILLLMKKGITEKLVHKVLGDIGNVMPLSVYMMIGFPTETRQEAMASYEAVKKFKTSGLISSFTYSMFIINHDSEIQGNPSAFGITRLHHDPDEDLKPDIAGFSGPGMGREEAFGLCMDFVREQAYPGISFEQLRHIVIDGERIAITHDTQKLRQATKSLWGALVLPFGKLVSQL